MLEPPGRNLRPTIDGDPMVLVNGRLLTPAGRHVRTQSYSWAMAISPDQSTAALASSGAIQFLSLDPLAVTERLAPYFDPVKRRSEDGTYMGLAFSPDGSKLYVSSANRGWIVIFDVKTRKQTGAIPLDGDGFEDSFVGDFVLGSDGRMLYAVDQFNYRLVSVDLDGRQGDAIGARGAQSVWRVPVARRASMPGYRTWACSSIRCCRA